MGLEADGVTAFVAFSAGRFSESNPVGDTGTATWRGAMVGEKSDRFVRGDAALEYDFADSTVDVRLTGIRDLNTPQGHPDLIWNGLQGKLQRRGEERAAKTINYWAVQARKEANERKTAEQ